MARQINVSRAILYRLEKGELVKIDTLERVADVLGAPLATLMGVGVEFYRDAALFFERKRQLEENALQIQGNFTPISFLLLSDEYIQHLRTMLLETQILPNSHHSAFEEYVERVLAVLRERRDVAIRRRTPIVSVISSQSVERFLHSGLIGRYDLKPHVIRKRQMYAKREVERLVEFFRKQPIGVQVGVVEDFAPDQTFQVFENSDSTAVTLSPYRLGEHPNISTGIAIVTSAPEAVKMFRQIIVDEWERANKGESGARVLESILVKTRR
jgi:transcriptional regulator with XRE-family HTH domain